MLHVFHVDSGRMMTFDMSLALESVDNLKHFVQEEFKIAAEKQVLLISGGECLDPNKRVCSYSAGTDTNPIFLFSKSIIESPTPPLPAADHSTESDIDIRVKEHCDMPVTFTTVSRRAQLAQQLHEQARKQLSTCEGLVHDQHLQQQGWSAVVANLEDITFEFRKRSEIFERSFNDYMEERGSYLVFLKHFNNDLEILQRIPVLSALLESEEPEVEASKSSQESDPGKDITLYEWISAADNKSTMDQLYDHCSRGLEQFDSNVFKSLKEDIQEMLRGADNPQMKEVKGLGERLSGLETLMREAKKFVQQQAELAQSFAKHQSRASNTKDASVLPDLCMTHKKQLQMMANNHQQLCDIKRRCTKAKEELSVNLYHRLRWVMYIEDHILEIDQKLVIYHENLKRLRRHLEVLQQIHLAPATYLCAVAEVVRRRAFSQTFLLWASELACHLLTIHNDEVTRRKEFQSQFDGHFLNSLFPGLDDLPPSFATQAPSMFDAGLPRITEEDVERLKHELPDLADNLNVPDTSAITNFFLIKSLVKKEEEESEAGAEGGQAVERDVEVAGESKDAAAIGGEVFPVTAHGLPHLKDLDRGCESETDTEEFEKVGQSPLELNFDTKNVPSPRSRLTQDASTSTEDNLQISRSEHDRLKTLLTKLHQLAKEATLQLRHELTDLRKQVLSNQSFLSQHCESLGSSWENIMVERDHKEKETLEGLIRNHEEAVNDLRKEREEKNRQIEGLLSEKSVLESEILSACQNLNEIKESSEESTRLNLEAIEELQRELREKDCEREKAVKEVCDRLAREHKAEIENIRSRFKLMNMDRSPSDPNLDKSGDFSSLPGHATLLLQMQDNFELDKEKAVSEALMRERDRWEKLLAIRAREAEHERQQLLQDVAAKVSEEKDAQIDVLRERERSLNLECVKYRSTIRQLAEGGAESENELRQKVAALEEEVQRLQAARETSLAASMAVYEGKPNVPAHKDAILQSDISPIRPPTSMVSVETCKPNDLVVVMWDPEYESFKVLQENKHLYFLHSDYLEGLGLEVKEARPNKFHVIGEVIDKEYCFARKSENRYKVPRHTKFFRVKVKLSTHRQLPKEVSQSVYLPPKPPSEAASRMSRSQSAVSVLLDRTAPQGSPPLIHPVILERDEVDARADLPPEKQFAEDSGIVDNEQAGMLPEETLTSSSRNESESSDRTDESILPECEHTLYEDQLFVL